MADSSLRPNEIEVSIGSETYIIGSASSPSAFTDVRDPDSGQPAQVSLDVAAELYGAQESWTTLNDLFGKVDVQARPASGWNSVLASAETVLFLENDLDALGNLAGLAAGAYLNPAGAPADAVGAFVDFVDGVSSNSVPVALATLGVSLAEAEISSAYSEYQTLVATVSGGGAISYGDIASVINDLVIAMAQGNAWASSVDYVFSGGLTSDLESLGESFFGGLAGVLGAGAPAELATMLQTAESASDAVSQTQDYQTLLQEIAAGLDSQSTGFAPLTDSGLEATASGLQSSPVVDLNLGSGSFPSSGSESETEAEVYIADGQTVSISVPVTNTILMAAVEGGLLQIDAPVSGGTLEAVSSGIINIGVGEVGGLPESAALTDVTLGGDGTGSYVGYFTDYGTSSSGIDGDAFQDVTVQSGVTFTAGGDGNNTALGGTIDNAGRLIAAPSTYSYPRESLGGAFVVDGPVTLDGGGVLEIDGRLEPGTDYVGDGFLLGLTPGADVLTNIDNTITGAGRIDVAVINQAKGVISAQGLTFNDALTNQGLAETSSGGGIILTGPVVNDGTLLADAGTISISGSVINAGTIEASSGGTIYIDAPVTGGTLEAVSSGTIQVGSATLRDGTISGGYTGAISIGSGGVVADVVIEGGALDLQSGASASQIVVVSGGLLLVSQGAKISLLGFEGGGAVDLAGVGSAEIDLSTPGELVLRNGGSILETVSLLGAVSPSSLSATDDGSGGTEILVSSGAVAPLSGAVTSAVSADETNYALFDPAGAPIASESITASGGQAVTQYFGSGGAQFAAHIDQSLGGGATQSQDFDGSWNQKDATIRYDLGGGSTLVESFDAAGDHIGATATTVAGDETIVQGFDGAWNQLSASIVTSDGKGVTVTQAFDSAWRQVSATYVVDQGNTVITQDFDAAWRQMAASIVTDLGGGTVETQDFDGNWSQTGATIVQHPNAASTITQHFDSAWRQMSAEIATISGSQTIDQTFDGNWNLTGGTVATLLSPDTDLIQTYDAQWNSISGGDQLTVQGQAAIESFADTPGVPTTFVFSPGDINGDAFSNFVTDAMNSSAHDVLKFIGYGPGAALSQIDASHWQITAPGMATEVFTLAAELNPAAGDAFFQ